MKIDIITEHSIPEPNSGCWLWISTVDSRKGYGRIWFNGIEERAHRVSAHLYLDFDLHSNLQIRHTCNNTCCVNPDHLVPGTNLENARDRKRNGGYTKRYCKRGHDQWDDNNITIIYNKDGTTSKRCQLCRRELRKNNRE